MKTTMKTAARKTTAQYAREEARDTAGRFIKNPCECCGKAAPVSDYYTDDRCNENGGWGLVLCKRCADKLAVVDDAAYTALANEKLAAKAVAQ